MEQLVIREARDLDLDAVARLRWQWQTGHPDDAATVTQEEFVAAFGEWARRHAASHRCTVAVRGDRVVGMAWLALVPRVPTPRSPERTTADVQSVYVDPSERGAGVGARLIEAVLAAARGWGVERVTVHSSVRAVPLYARAGFASGPLLLDLRLTGVPGGAQRPVSRSTSDPPDLPRDDR